MRKVASDRNRQQPRTRDEWIGRLCDALVSESETSHQSVISAMVSNGIRQDDILQSYIPEAAQRLGEFWLNDSASFVGVTVGAARLQRLYRDHAGIGGQGWPTRSIPLGQSALMIVPSFETHSLGGFAAADQLRRHGVWVHMAIGLNAQELRAAIHAAPFSMIGLSIATAESLDKASELIAALRETIEVLPPIVVGGRIVSVANNVAQRCGADYAVTTAREAVSYCGLATLSTRVGSPEIC
ncbi:cobalamin B12-binding domain-containing protein [Tropicibacter sp. S64]|uniref:cobalamin B12-binding domain-containing protein n=1 Tax=Tropicibacter sp. S64 TaxID=3415122 RepID=UPI003C7DBF06